MHLQVRFEKLDPHTCRLRCTRQPDGKELWMYTPHQPGLPHDLLHYLVETELGIEAAMYGQMLSSEAIHAHPVTGMFVGYDTGNQDSVNTETIAGVLDWVDWSARPGWEDLRRFCAEAFDYYRLPMPQHPESRWRALHAALEAMLERWPQVPVGGVVELEYPPARPF